MRTIPYQLVVALLVVVFTLWHHSGVQLAPAATCDSASSDSCCPQCQLEVDKSKIKEYCYDVQCKTICIPRITFPWQKGCENGCDAPCSCCPIPPNGAKIKTVRVLKKFEYECEKCKYKWTPECVSGSNGDCGCDVQRNADSRCASLAPLPSLQATARRDGVLPAQHVPDLNGTVLVSADKRTMIAGNDSEPAAVGSRFDWFRKKVRSYKRD
jgi:hypothetical protein